MRPLYATIIVALSMAGIAGAAAAQDCRGNCVECGAGSWESSGPANPLGYAGACLAAHCDECLPSLKRNTPQEDAIFAAIRGAQVVDLAQVVAKYRRNLLLHPGRQLLVTKGLGCDRDALGSVMFLTREQTAALMKAGLGDLATFVAKQASVTRATATAAAKLPRSGLAAAQ